MFKQKLVCQDYGHVWMPSTLCHNFVPQVWQTETQKCGKVWMATKLYAKDYSIVLPGLPIAKAICKGLLEWAFQSW
jgi:hypothetical protein